MPVVVSCRRCVRMKHLSAVTILGLGVSNLNKTLPFAATFSGFGDLIPWLVYLTFFFIKGFIKSGLKKYIAYQFDVCLTLRKLLAEVRV
ncbi:hypothetical protein AHAS_Ahas01G0105700 [Arachis hypogaea]